MLILSQTTFEQYKNNPLHKFVPPFYSINDVSNNCLNNHFPVPVIKIEKQNKGKQENCYRPNVILSKKKGTYYHLYLG